MAKKDHQSSETNAVLDAKLANIRDDLSEMKGILRGEYVRRDEFLPVKQVVFGLVAAVLMAVLGGLISIVVKK
jgi:hypothetical protein